MLVVDKYRHIGDLFVAWNSLEEPDSSSEHHLYPSICSCLQGGLLRSETLYITEMRIEQFMAYSCCCKMTTRFHAHVSKLCVEVTP